MKRPVTLVFCLSALYWGAISQAEEKSDSMDTVVSQSQVKSESSWKGEAELGVVQTSGNTDTSSINGRIDFTNEQEKWRHNFHLEAYKSESDELTSAERYQFSEKSDYKFSHHDYVFFRTEYDDDRFSGFDYQASFSIGYGHRFINRDGMFLDLEIGPGARYSSEKEMSTERDEFIRLASKYVWEITASSRFVQEVTSDRGADLTVSKSITTIQANLNSKLAMKLTHTIRHQSNVPVGTLSTDRETATTLVYLF